MAASTSSAASEGAPGGLAAAADRARFRYGIVLLITFTLVVFQIAAPGAPWSRAVAVGLEVLGFGFVVATSRARAEVRLIRAVIVLGVGVAAVVLIAAEVLSSGVAFVLGGMLALAIPVALLGGLIRLLRQHGVTLQAVLGALTIYLYVGLLFAWVIGFVSTVDTDPYFAGPPVGPGDRVYFSFTALTTTGFGDYTPITPFGHALAVVEMLFGQLYLVTVIGVLVGHLAGRRPD